MNYKTIFKLSLVLLTTVSICDSYAQNKRRIVDMLELPAYSNTMNKEQVVFHFAYTLSYNPKHHIPNWSAWVLYGKNVQNPKFKRLGNFPIDPKINKGCSHQSDYTYSGYSRGHMCPAGDNSWNATAIMECNYMSNICPQSEVLNNGRWKKLEERCRKWAIAYGEIYIVCGPIIPKRVSRRIGNNVTVPYKYFKAIMRLDHNGECHMIGYIFNQENQYQTYSIDEIERQTGLDLFHNLDDKIEIRAEKEINYNKWLHWDR